jgi:hypothetical protein
MDGGNAENAGAIFGLPSQSEHRIRARCRAQQLIQGFALARFLR